MSPIPPVCIAGCHHSWEERFIKYRTSRTKKSDSKTNDVAMGWYSKEDMVKVLKWNKNLSCT